MNKFIRTFIILEYLLLKMSVKDIDKLIKDLESNLSINKDNVEKLCDSLSCLMLKTKNIDRNNTSNKRILVSKKKGKKFTVF